MIKDIWSFWGNKSEPDRQNETKDLQLSSFKKENIILRQLIEGQAYGNEKIILNSMTELKNHLIKHSKDDKNLIKQNEILLHNLESVINFHFDKVEHIASKLSYIHQSFDDYFKLEDLKAVKNAQQLFTMFDQQSQQEKLLNMQILEIGKQQQYVLQESQFQSEQRKNPQLQAFVTVFWIGKSVLGMIALKFKNKEKRIPTSSKDKKLYLNDNSELIDPDIYTVISQYFQWMMQIPSFSKLLDAYQNRISTKVLQLPGEKDLLDEDKLIFNSASNFKERFKKIIEEKLETEESWKLLYEDFLSKQEEINVSQERRKQFDQLVGRMQSLLGGDNSQQSRVKVKQEDKQSSREKITTSHKGNYSSRKQDSGTTNQLQQKFQLIEQKQRLQKYLSQKVEQLRKLQASLKNSQERNQHLLKQIQESVVRSQQCKKREANFQSGINQLKNQLEKQQKQNQNRQQNLQQQLKYQQQLNQSIKHQLEDQRKYNQNIQYQLKEQRQLNQKLMKQLQDQQQFNYTLKQNIKSIDKTIQSHCAEINMEIGMLTSGSRVKLQPTRDRTKNKLMQDSDSIIKSIERCLTETKAKIKTHSLSYKDSISKLQAKINEITKQNILLIKQNQSLQQSINSTQKLNISSIK